MEPLNSTNLSGCQYDPDTRALTIAFNSGALYEYAGVDPDTYEGLKSSLSPGVYFRTNIKDRFPSSRIG